MSEKNREENKPFFGLCGGAALYYDEHSDRRRFSSTKMSDYFIVL